MARKTAKPKAAGVEAEAALAAANPAVASNRLKQAVVVVHGMGEQRPMETLRDLVTSLANDRDVFVVPDQATGSAELARIRVPGHRKNPGEPSTDFYEFYYADLLGGGTFAQLRGWILGLMVRWPHQVPKEVWRIWIFLWGVVIATLAWLGPLLASNPVKQFTDFMGTPKGNPNANQLAGLTIACLLLAMAMSIRAWNHAHTNPTMPNEKRTLPATLSYLTPS